MDIPNSRRPALLLHAGMLILLMATTGCQQRAASGTSESGKLNSAAPASVMSPPSSATQVDPEVPKAGMNTARPDAVKDVSPDKR